MNPAQLKELKLSWSVSWKPSVKWIEPLLFLYHHHFISPFLTHTTPSLFLFKLHQAFCPEASPRAGSGRVSREASKWVIYVTLCLPLKFIVSVVWMYPHIFESHFHWTVFFVFFFILPSNTLRWWGVQAISGQFKCSLGSKRLHTQMKWKLSFSVVTALVLFSFLQ